MTGDDDLAPGERAFTDYGQFGVDMIDTRVLWQDVVWVDRMGTPHFLTVMSHGYRGNVIAYLYRRAPEWYLEAVIDAFTDIADAVATAATAEVLQKPVDCLDAVLNDLTGAVLADWADTLAHGLAAVRALEQVGARVRARDVRRRAHPGAAGVADRTAAGSR